MLNIFLQKCKLIWIKKFYWQTFFLSFISRYNHRKMVHLSIHKMAIKESFLSHPFVWKYPIYLKNYPGFSPYNSSLLQLSIKAMELMASVFMGIAYTIRGDNLTLIVVTYVSIRSLPSLISLICFPFILQIHLERK